MPPIDFASTDATPEERPLRSRRAFDGRLVQVRVDTVRLPSGRETEREIVEHPGSVVVLPITTDGEVVMVRQHRHAVGRSLVELPAGLIDPGEAPEATAARELEEETGLRAGRMHPLGAVLMSPGYTTERSHLFVATGCAGELREPGPDEPMTLVRVPLADLPSLLQPGASPIEDAQALLTIAWYLRVRDDLRNDM